MRSKFSKILLWTFIGFISFVFIAYFGAYDQAGSNQIDNVVGSVDSYEIKNYRYSPYYYAYENVYEYYRRQGSGVSSYEAISNQAFAGLIEQHVLLQVANASKIHIEENDLLLRLKVNYGDQQFDYLANRAPRVERRSVKSNYDRALRVHYLSSAIFPNQLKASLAAKEAFFDVVRREKKIMIAQFNTTQLAEKKVTDQLLQAYYKENKERYVKETPANNTNDDLIKNDDSPIQYQSYDEAYTLIRQDFLIEEGSLFTDALKEQIQETISNFSAENPGLSSSEKQVAALAKTFEELGLTTQVSDYFSLYSSDIPLLGSDAKKSPAPKEFLRSAMLSSLSSVIPPYDYGVTVYTGFVLEQRDLEEKEEELSEFLKTRYTQILDNQTSARLKSDYLTYVYGLKEILYKGENWQ